MLDPTCTVNGSATTNGVDVAKSSVPLIALAVPSGSLWDLRCVYTDDGNSAAAVNASLVVNQTNKTATYTHPANVSALIFQSRVGVNALGYDANNQYQSAYTTTFGVFTLTAEGNRVIATGERLESSASFGWVKDVNNLIRQAASAVGSFYTWAFGGSTASTEYDVGARVITTNATPSTLATYALPASTDAKFVVIVKARETSGGATRRACFWKADDYERVVAAAPTRSLTNVANVDLGSDAGGTPWTCTIKPSSNDIIVEAVGQAATTIDWTVRFQVLTNTAT